ncbi:MAG TPA: type II toxin-antitoxin system CcdA family antitoxin [Sphingopyxis sp.]|uniref:type II toxin-antitoxin system CcdA family antitoxin n=1 Tax=Sphingopyxis sp. TaxID=1908224 RepID=UPI002E0D3941|nr:type II toxin-antitoxin system CcdA family antitoxin [Sphingopyxis sp.]
MNRQTRFEGPKKPTNVSLSAELVDEAKKLEINVSEACQAGLLAEVKKAREAAWKAENRAAMEASNEYVRKHGLPLAKYRQF